MDLDAVRALARDRHRGQRDKSGLDYADAHLAPVAAELEPHGEHAVMAGWLHDVLEDTGTTAVELRALGVPDAVVDAVVAVTKVDGEPYDALIARAAAHPLGRVVKLADNAVNLRRNAELDDPELAARLRDKYERARTTLLAAEPTP